MTPSHLRKRAIQLTVIYVIAVVIAYIFVDSYRDSIRANWIWFAVPPVLLVLLAIFSNTRFIESVLLMITPKGIRKRTWYLALIYVLVIAVIYLFRPDLRTYFHENWLRT